MYVELCLLLHTHQTTSVLMLPNAEPFVPYSTEPAENAEDIPKPKTGALSTPSLLSHTSTSSAMPPSCDYGYHKILGWLRFVDDILDKHRTNELLYLGAYYEIKESLMEKCKHPSELQL